MSASEKLELVSSKAGTEPDTLDCVFVRYEPGARTGQFHHYVERTLTLEEFKALVPAQ